jgi:hypothetical protein
MDRNTPSSSLSLTEINPRSVAPVSLKMDIMNTPSKIFISGKEIQSETSLPATCPSKGKQV